MQTLREYLATYAAYHRDRRNVASHFVGIPLIVLAIEVLLARPVLVLGPFAPSPAWIAVLAASLFYLRLDLRLGATMAAVLALGLVPAAWAGAQPATIWLAIGAGAFVAGWAFQLVGHVFEGRKPAFLDDLAGLLVGPLFIVVEAALALGLRRELAAALHCGAPAPGDAALTGR